MQVGRPRGVVSRTGARRPTSVRERLSLCKWSLVSVQYQREITSDEEFDRKRKLVGQVCLLRDLQWALR